MTTPTPTFLPEFSGFLESDEASLLKEDIIKWCAWRKRETPKTTADFIMHAAFLVRIFPEFCSIMDYRLSTSANFKSLKVVPEWPRATDLYLRAGSIGPGIIVAHGHGTWVFAESVGKNFVVNQHVTIGHDGKKGIPTIGDNVTVRTGAVVVGKITIGDNVLVAANAVVSFDVPSNSRVFAPKSIIVPNKS